MAYYVVVFSFIRQFIILHLFHPLARKLGMKSEGKLNRFGEQGYALLYFSVMGVWGVVSYFQKLVAMNEAPF